MIMKKSKKAKKTPCLSSRFNTSDYDITLQSCDNVTFKVHKKYLEMNSNGFAAPAATISTPDEVVSLTESSTVLDLLLQHIYPGPQPDLDKIKFVDLAGVAEAAQKYEVWPAMNVTKAHMRLVAPKHGFDVLVYAAKHDFPDLANEAIKYCGNVPMTEALERLNPLYLKGFAQFIEAWRSAFEAICRTSILHYVEDYPGWSCAYWAYKVETVQRALRNSNGPSEELLNQKFHVLMEEFNGEELFSCNLCYKDMEDWRQRYIDSWNTIKSLNVYP